MVLIAPNALIAANAQIAPTTVIAPPFRPLLDGRRLTVGRDTVVGDGVWIGHYTTIGQGVTIGEGSIVEDFVAIQPETVIKHRVLVTSRSWIGIGVTVGTGSIIRGHIGDGSWIGERCRVAGELIHRHFDPSISWDDPAGAEPAATVEDGAFVGWRALIVGGVTIGAGAYICAGALITRDVPAGYIGFGRNQIVHPSAWPGRLGQSPFLQDAHRSQLARPKHCLPQPGQDRLESDVEDPRPAGNGVITCELGASVGEPKDSQVPEHAGRHRRLDR
jgi:acetyltransferase-like isoleucine patch superfamily enzyme